MPITLEARVELLERQARYLRRCLLGAVVVASIAIAFVITGAEAGGHKDIVANSVEVVSKTGKHSVTLSTTDDGFAGLFFRDLNGVLRAGLLVEPSGRTTLSFNDQHVSRLVLGQVENATDTMDQFSVSMRDSKGKVIWEPPAANPVEVKE